ncbi:MAG: hypothetical protein KGI54_15910 [Pseudomonadota bacterium]|nr:hypothetical protein [Pseudomonadota bacterium]
MPAKKFKWQADLLKNEPALSDLIKKIELQRENEKDVLKLSGIDRALIALRRQSKSDVKWLSKWIWRFIG